MLGHCWTVGPAGPTQKIQAWRKLFRKTKRRKQISRRPPAAVTHFYFRRQIQFRLPWTNIWRNRHLRCCKSVIRKLKLHGPPKRVRGRLEAELRVYSLGNSLAFPMFPLLYNEQWCLSNNVALMGACGKLVDPLRFWWIKFQWVPQAAFFSVKKSHSQHNKWLIFLKTAEVCCQKFGLLNLILAFQIQRQVKLHQCSAKVSKDEWLVGATLLNTLTY